MKFGVIATPGVAMTLHGKVKMDGLTQLDALL